MKKIILDTSILRSLSLSKSAEVEALNKLIKYEHVEVYLPYIIS